MTKLGGFEVHPMADKFRLLDGQEFLELVADVKNLGLREPIVVDHTKTVLIDGRNRLRACEASGTDPVFNVLGPHYTEDMFIDLILSTNVKRRHLSRGERTALGLEAEEMYAAAMKPGPKPGDRPKSTKMVVEPPRSPSSDANKARSKAAEKTGATARDISFLKAIKRDAVDLYELVRDGHMSIDAAERERKKRMQTKPKPEPAPAPARTMLTLYTHTGTPIQYPEPKGKPTFNQTTGEGISWAAWSWNPVTGCLHGCNYCYAREIADNAVYAAAFPAAFTPLFHPERLPAPANTAIPALHRDDPAWERVFVCSMADLYGQWVPKEWIEQVHAAMNASPQWQYLTLTKFPKRYLGLTMPPKAWVGTSVDEQKRVRIAEEAFKHIDGVAVKWLSLEPLLEPLEFKDLSVFDWVVIGAQTQTNQPDKGAVPAFAPPFDWVARIVAQAREAGCRVHLKPNLMGDVHSQSPGMTLPDEYPLVMSHPNE